jgi:hypothetical protein
MQADPDRRHQHRHRPTCPSRTDLDPQLPRAPDADAAARGGHDRRHRGRFVPGLGRRAARPRHPAPCRTLEWLCTTETPILRSTLADLLLEPVRAARLERRGRAICPPCSSCSCCSACSMQAGERHAITTLARYGILIVGVIVLAFSTHRCRLGEGAMARRRGVGRPRLRSPGSLRQLRQRAHPAARTTDPRRRPGARSATYHRPRHAHPHPRHDDPGLRSQGARRAQPRVRHEPVRQLDAQRLGRALDDSRSELPTAPTPSSRCRCSRRHRARSRGTSVADPPPEAVFVGFADSTLEPPTAPVRRHERARLPLDDRPLPGHRPRKFREAGIEIAFPQRDVNLHLPAADRRTAASPRSLPAKGHGKS